MSIIPKEYQTLSVGLQPLSTVDWEENLSTVLFFSGCNLACPYCHNPELARGNTENTILLEEALAIIHQRRGFIDGVVLSGGEPTLYADAIHSIAEYLKAMNLKVKLDTNGLKPEVVQSLIQHNLIDMVALDLKTLPDMYSLLGASSASAKNIDTTITYLKKTGIPFEIRTTTAPGIINTSVLLQLADYLIQHDIQSWILQRYNDVSVLDPKYFHGKTPIDFEHILSVLQNKNITIHQRGWKTEQAAIQ